MGLVQEREPEKRLLLPRRGAGAQITQSQFDEVVTRNIHIGSYNDSIMGMSMIQKH